MNHLINHKQPYITASQRANFVLLQKQSFQNGSVVLPVSIKSSPTACRRQIYCLFYRIYNTAQQLHNVPHSSSKPTSYDVIVFAEFVEESTCRGIWRDIGVVCCLSVAPDDFRECCVLQYERRQWVRPIFYHLLKASMDLNKTVQ